MSFNPNSLKRLKDLERKLSKEFSNKQNRDKNQIKKQSSTNLHPIETEKNPELLFHELIKASKDGNIPKHLINRLQELENQQHFQSSNSEQKSSEDSSKRVKIKQNKKEISNKKEKELLYSEFNRLILEIDD